MVLQAGLLFVIVKKMYLKNIFTLVCLSSIFLRAQEIVPIKNYTPQIYKAQSQNWSIDQASNKTIYVGNNQGLLEFKGSKWKLYKSPNQTPMRAVKVVGNRIYTGNHMDFGYWQTNHLGQLYYTSLADKMPISFTEDEDIWKIISLDKWMLFQSLQRIYIYDTQQHTFKMISSTQRIQKMFKVFGDIYYQKMGLGLYKIQNGKEVLVSDLPFIKTEALSNVFAYERKLLLLTIQKGAYILSGNSLKNWNVKTFEHLKKTSFYSSLKLKNGEFILGTISQGMYHLDRRGNILSHINKNRSLLNNTVLSIGEDTDGNVWLGLDNGLSTLNLTSSFKVYNDIRGVLGTTYASMVYRDKLYIGTNQGLFYRDLHQPQKPFQFIKGTKGQVWCLKKIRGTLFCGHNSGTYVIEGNNANLISNVLGTWDIKTVPNHKNILLQGHYIGLSVLEKKHGRWRLKNKIKGFDSSVRYFEFIEGSHILVNHEYKGTYKLKLDTHFSRVQNSVLLPIEKSPKSSLVRYKDKVLYTCDKGIFYWDSPSKMLKRDDFLSQVFLTNENYVSGKLIVLNDETLCAFTKRNIILFSSGKMTDKYSFYKVPLPATQRKDPMGFENISIIKERLYLLGTSSGYLLIDLKKMKNNSNFNFFITRVSMSGVDRVKNDLPIIGGVKIPNDKNNVTFEYAIPNYQKYVEILYQYKLEGLYNHWGSWTNKTSVSFENLPFGAYAFSLRVRVGNQISKAQIYAFNVQHPWYLSTTYLIFYTLGFVVFAVGVHLLYKRYYKKQRKILLHHQQRELSLQQLETEQKLIRLRNEQLHRDIKTKNKELATSAIGILNKNTILNKIKTALSKLKPSLAVQEVIKMIETHLKNTDDWNSFREAFDNTDKDFLKKLKQKHSNLTPQDLRLSVYLRINLSSKEIAPLLNISYKSVEIKRYRLRKKMGLVREKKLVDYILSI